MSFGKRTGPIPLQAQPRPFTNTALKDADTPAGATNELDARARILQYCSDILIFSGALLIYFVLGNWPDDPSAFSGLDNKILVPGVLRDLLPANFPAISGFRASAGNISSFYSNQAAMIIFLLGVVSIVRGRWLTLGCIVAFFTLPWSALGTEAPQEPMIAAILIMGSTIKLLQKRYPRLFKFAAISTIILPLPFLIGVYFIHMIIPDFKGPVEKYYALPVAKISDGNRAGINPLNETGTRFRDMQAVTADQRSAKSFVMAQIYASAGNYQEASAELNTAKQIFGAGGVTGRRVVGLVENFLAGQGIYGNAARDVSLEEYSRSLWMSRLMAILGLILGLLGPFLDILSTRMARRSKGILETSGRISVQKMKLDAINVSPVAVQQQDPLVAVDAKDTMERMTKRIYAYRTVGLLALALALMSTNVWLSFGLPPATSNSAFQSIALLGNSMKEFLPPKNADPGLLDDIMSAQGSTFWNLLLGAAIIFNGFGIYTYARKYLVSFIIVMMMANIAPMHGIHQPGYWGTFEARDITPRIRQILVAATRAPQAIGREIGTQQLKPVTSGAPAVEKKAKVAAKLNPSIAAYVLAQTAYLEGQPAVATEYLAFISSNSIKDARAQQRVEILRDWVGAHGFPVVMPSWSGSSTVSIATMRFVGDIAKYVAGFSLLLIVSSLALALFAFKRRGTINELLKQRHGQTFSNRASRLVFSMQQNEEKSPHF